MCTKSGILKYVSLVVTYQENDLDKFQLGLNSKLNTLAK